MRDLSGGEPRVLRGAIALGLPTDEVGTDAQEGVVANIRLGDVDVDAWERLLSECGGHAIDANCPAPAASSTGSSGALTRLPSHEPGARARELTSGGRTLSMTWWLAGPVTGRPGVPTSRRNN